MLQKRRRQSFSHLLLAVALCCLCVTVHGQDRPVNHPDNPSVINASSNGSASASQNAGDTDPGQDNSQGSSSPAAVDPSATAAAPNGSPGSNGPAGKTPSVPKWSVQEITLTAKKSKGYLDGAITATVTGPNGIKDVVSGFWDGGSTWRIRFAPTVEGTWNYVTSSSDPGLNKNSGSFLCVSATSGNHGFVRRDAANIGSFVWDDGSRCFVWGQSYYDVMLNVVAGGGWKAAVDNSASDGMNKIRFHVYPAGVYTPGLEDTTYPKAIPYGGTPSSPNRDQLNIPFWQALDTYVRYLESKGMIADLIVFDSYVDFGAYQFGTQTQDARFLRYTLARYAAFHNVIWCVANEWAVSHKPQSYIDTLGTIIHSEDPWMGNGANLRPLSVHQNTRIDFQFFGSSWPVHAIIQYGVRNGTYVNGDQWGNAGILYNDGTMPVVNDEYGYIGETATINLTREQHRSAIWGIATAGGYGSAGDIRRTPTGNPEVSGDWNDAPEYGDIKNMVSFFTTKGIPYWQMSSRNSLVTSGTRVYALGQTDQEYVVYAGIGGSFTLQLPAGNYNAWQFDPRNGTETPLSTVSGEVSLTMPDSNDWVVRLRRTL